MGTRSSVLLAVPDLVPPARSATLGNESPPVGSIFGNGLCIFLLQSRLFQIIVHSVFGLSAVFTCTGAISNPQPNGAPR